MGDVANLLVGARLNKPDAASVAKQFKSLLDQIEKDKIKLNIDDADLKSKTLEALSQLKELQEADFSDPRNQKALQSFFDGFKNGKKNISDIGALIRKTAKDIKPLLRQATDNPLVNQLTSREKKALAEKQEALNLAKENYDEVKKNSKSNAKSRYLQVANEQKQDLKNLQNIKNKFLSKTEKDEIQSGSADRLGQLRSQLGLPDTEDANKILSQYSEVLSVYDKINQKRQKISDLTSEKELDDEVRKLQGLSSTSSYISKLEGVLNKKYGVENFDSPKFKMKDMQFQFVGKYSELMENSANLAVEKARKAVIDYTKQTLNKQQQKNEKALKQAGLYDEPDKTSTKDSGVDIPDTSSATDDGYAELRKQALDKIKSEYASYTKYAVEEQDAINELNKLHKQFKNSGSSDTERYLDDKEIKDVIGYQSRLKSLGKALPKNISDMMKTSGFKESLEYYNDDTDNISSQKIEKQIESMTAAQTAAMEKLKKARQEINESIGDSGVESTQTETGSSVQNEIQDLSELESKINEINTKLTELNTNLNGVNGQAFEEMKSQISGLQEELNKYLSLLDKVKNNTNQETQTLLPPTKLTESDISLGKKIAQQIKYDEQTGYFSQYDLINDYYKSFKNTSAYLKKENELIEERAILIKKGKQIGKEFISSGEKGAVSVGDAIKQYSPDSVLHTHPFDSQVDYLRFSAKDINELVDGSIKQALLMCGDELATLDMSNVSDFKSLQKDILDIYNAVFLRYGAALNNNKITGIESLPTNIQNLATRDINALMSGIASKYGGELLFDKYENEGFQDNDKARISKITPNDFSILNKFIDAISSEQYDEKYINNLQKQYSPISKKNKDIQNDKYGLFEESNGQMSMFDKAAKSSDNIAKAQSNTKKQIKKTNDDIKGQINLFDVLKDKEEEQITQTKKLQDQKNESDKTKDTQDKLPDQSDTSSEISNMQQLSSAIQQVTESVNNKTLAFLEEEDIVSQVVSSEISAMESLSKSVDEVSKSLDKQKDKLKDHNDDLKEIKDTQKKNDSDSNQKDKKQTKSKNTKSKSTDSTTKQTKTPEISNIPSTYVKNVDRAFDQASKINNAIDKAEIIKAELAHSATEATQDVIDKSTQDIDSILHRLKKTDRPNVASADNELDRIQERTKKIAQTLNIGALFRSSLSTSGIANMPSVINNVTSAVDKLDTELKSGAISVSQYGSRLDNIKKQIRDVDGYADDSTVALSKMHNKLKDQLGDNAKYTYHPTRYDRDGNRIESISGSANGIKTTQTWNESIGTIVSSTTKQTQGATRILGGFFDGLKSRWSALGQYILSFGSFYEIWDLFKQGVQISKELDDALTEMNKVSDAPLFKLQNYQKESFDMADEIGSTGVQIQKSTADFLRLGESFEDAKKSAEAANVLYNVSEFESIDAATESLIAMSAAYKGMDKMDINDKLNNIGNNFSISTDGLATALQTSASALTTAGADIDESIALITAGNAVVQDPASVGAGIRTIALRLMGTEEAKEQLETTGEDTSDYIVQTASKIDEAFRAFTAVKSNEFKGISILDENGNNRSVYDILQDVADIYEEIVATDKQFGTNHLNGLLELMAGKQRSNIAASIIQNAGTLRNVYESSQNSEGSALEENQKHLDSIQGHLDQLKNKWQEVWSGAGRDVVNPILDAGTGILDIISNLGLLKSTIAGIIGAFGIKGALKGGGIFSNLFGWSKFPGLQLKTFLSEPPITEIYT